MGQNFSIACGNIASQHLAWAICEGDVDLVQRILDDDLKPLNQALFYDRQTPLHIAASNGQFQVLSKLLERGARPNEQNKNGQTSLMLACKNGHWMCIEPLLAAGANILGFDFSHRRTCLHYASRGGHMECVRKILDASRRGPVSRSWGLARFVNVRDCRGHTAAHMASRMGHASVLRLLLDSGALVSATTTTIGNGPGPGSSPIHYAAKGGSLESVRELLAWGADRNQRDFNGYTPFRIAMKYNNTACAAILNPHAAEPLVWPSPWKFMSESELEPEAKTVLQAALAQANIELDKEIAIQASQEEVRRLNARKPNNRRRSLASVLAVSGQRISPTAMCSQEADTAVPAETQTQLTEEVRSSVVADLPSEAPTEEARKSMVGDLPGGDLHSSIPDGVNTESMGVQEVCCICFEEFCTIEVKECGHQMCAKCTLSLCCHSKPNPAIPYSAPPSCPFCRHRIGRLILARPKPKLPEGPEKKPKRKLKRSRSKNLGSFTGSILNIALGGSKRHGGSGRIADADWVDRYVSKKLGASARIADAVLDRCGSRKHGASARIADAEWLDRCGSKKFGASGRVADADMLELCAR